MIPLKMVGYKEKPSESLENYGLKCIKKKKAWLGLSPIIEFLHFMLLCICKWKEKLIYIDTFVADVWSFSYWYI